MKCLSLGYLLVGKQDLKDPCVISRKRGLTGGMHKWPVHRLPVVCTQLNSIQHSLSDSSRLLLRSVLHKIQLSTSHKHHNGTQPDLMQYVMQYCKFIFDCWHHIFKAGRPTLYKRFPFQHLGSRYNSNGTKGFLKFAPQIEFHSAHSQ